MRHARLFFLILSVVAAFGSCKEEPDRIPCNGTNPTWDGQVQQIVLTSCIASICHEQASTRGDFTRYNYIKPTLDDGSFEQRVLIDRSMPQDTPLADTTLALLQCWLEHGYPEN